MGTVSNATTPPYLVALSSFSALEELTVRNSWTVPGGSAAAVGDLPGTTPPLRLRKVTLEVTETGNSAHGILFQLLECPAVCGPVELLDVTTSAAAPGEFAAVGALFKTLSGSVLVDIKRSRFSGTAAVASNVGVGQGGGVELNVQDSVLLGDDLSLDVAAGAGPSRVAFSRLSQADAGVTCTYVTDEAGVPTASPTTCP